MSHSDKKKSCPLADKALMRALTQRNAAALQRAILGGADLHRVLGPTGWTPLHKACADGWVAGVELITHAPDAFVPHHNGLPSCHPLWLAAPAGLMLVDFLIRRGFPVPSDLIGAIEARLPESDRLLWQLLRGGGKK